jgi:iron complex outermembrane receptor protein
MLRISTISCCLLLQYADAALAQTDSTKKNVALKEVSISAQKNAIEHTPGKTVVNVQAMTITAGKTVLDLLRNIPGVTVDGSGNISITGKQGVLVTIDGRQTYLSGDELRDYLRSMTAEEVDQVEVMSQPPSGFDAEGNAGIINIKTRKTRRKGLNGNLTSSYSKSKLYAGNSTLLLNYRKNKLNLYTRLNYINAEGTVDWAQDYKFTNLSGNVLATSATNSRPIEMFEKNNEHIGADYFLSDNTSMGVMFTGAYYGNTMHSVINTRDASGQSITNTLRNTDESSLRRNFATNAWYKHSFSKNSELNINLDYLLYTRLMDQYLITNGDKDGVPLSNLLELKSKLPYNIQVKSLRADHTYSTKSGIKLESGVKYSYVTVDYNTRYDVVQNGSWVFDPTRTNHFIYKEQIAAAYASINKKFGERWEAKLGVRGEYAVIDAVQLATNYDLTRKMPALFPSVYVSYRPDSINYFEANVGRRVERPEYRQLNPFNYYTFYNTYQRGNPELLPQYSYNTELKHVYKEHWTTSAQLSLATNVISYINVADYTTQITYGMPVNYRGNTFADLSFTYNGKPCKWWDLMASVSGRYGAYHGLYNNLPVFRDGFGCLVQLYSEFKWGKWSADCWASKVSDIVSSPVVTDQSVVYITAGVGRKLMKDKLNVRLIANDPFYLCRNGYITAQPDLRGTSLFTPNSRDCTLAITYTFGTKNDNNTARKEQRTDEAGRVGM